MSFDDLVIIPVAVAVLIYTADRLARDAAQGLRPDRSHLMGHAGDFARTSVTSAVPATPSRGRILLAALPG
jgi:hypothetical protein